MWKRKQKSRYCCPLSKNYNTCHSHTKRKPNILIIHDKHLSLWLFSLKITYHYLDVPFAFYKLYKIRFWTCKSNIFRDRMYQLTFVSFPYQMAFDNWDTCFHPFHFREFFELQLNLEREKEKRFMRTCFCNFFGLNFDLDYDEKAFYCEIVLE